MLSFKFLDVHHRIKNKSFRRKKTTKKKPTYIKTIHTRNENDQDIETKNKKNKH